MKEILATLAVIILGAACVDRETYTERLEGVPLLLGEFTSYATEAHVRTQLGSRQVETLERGGTRAAEGRPPFEIVGLRAAHSHLGHAGQVELTLFNDRLMAARFYPADIDSYASALKRAGVSISLEIPSVPQANVRIMWGRDHAGRSYVAWSDTRLTIRTTAG